MPNDSDHNMVVTNNAKLDIMCKQMCKLEANDEKILAKLDTVTNDLYNKVDDQKDVCIEREGNCSKTFVSNSIFRWIVTGIVGGMLTIGGFSYWTRHDLDIHTALANDILTKIENCFKENCDE